MESVPSLQLAISLFGFLTWYLGIYRTVEEETNQCINRIEYMLQNKEWVLKPDRDQLKKAILANRFPLKIFEKRWFRFVVIWAPIVFAVFITSISLIVEGLSPSLINPALLEIGAGLVSNFLILSGVVVLVSVIILAIAFKDHPEAQYLEVFFLILNEKMKVEKNVQV